MLRGAITEHIDVAQIVLYVFWAFFAGLIFYLRQEDRREGYPLEHETSGKVERLGWPYMPDPKTFNLADGTVVKAPNMARDNREIAAKPVGGWPGAPLHPTGNPMSDAVGPASYAERADRPDVNAHGDPRIVPMRASHGYTIAAGDPDPRGMPVIGCDSKKGGVVTEVWIDQAEHMIRYLEVEVTTDAGKRHVLLPMTFAIVRSKPRQVYVHAIRARQFAGVPGIKGTDTITLREEDRICGYYGGGCLYATPERSEPIL